MTDPFALGDDLGPAFDLVTIRIAVVCLDRLATLLSRFGVQIAESVIDLVIQHSFEFNLVHYTIHFVETAIGLPQLLVVLSPTARYLKASAA